MARKEYQNYIELSEPDGKSHDFWSQDLEAGEFEDISWAKLSDGIAISHIDFENGHRPLVT